MISYWGRAIKDNRLDADRDALLAPCSKPNHDVMGQGHQIFRRSFLVSQ